MFSEAGRIRITGIFKIQSFEIIPYTIFTMEFMFCFFSNSYCLREKPTNLFANPEPIGQLKSLLNKNTPTISHRSLPATTVGNQNIFFCRYVYDYRLKRILKNPALNNANSNPMMTTTSSMTTSSM